MMSIGCSQVKSPQTVQALVNASRQELPECVYDITEFGQRKVVCQYKDACWGDPFNVVIANHAEAVGCLWQVRESTQLE